MSERKVTNIEVEILDVERLGKEAFEWLSKKEETAVKIIEEETKEDTQDSDASIKFIGCSVVFPVGIVRTPLGMYAMCTEGVGSRIPITEETPLELEFYKKYEGGIAMYPSMKHTMSDTKVVDYLTGEKKNLADFIRVFGARLEDNYISWLYFLERRFAEEVNKSEAK